MSKWFAVVDGDMFLQRFEPNEHYKTTGRAIQTNLHDQSEFTPIFAYEEKWFDPITLSGYMPILIDSARWDKRRHITYGIIAREGKTE